MIAGTLEIQLLANMARLQQDMNQAKSTVSNAMAGIERAAASAKMALGSIGLGVGLSQLIPLVDQYTKFTAQLKLATTSTTDYAKALSSVRAISKEAQSDIAATGNLYAKIANATKEIGSSQKTVADITKVVSLGLKVSGATAQEASSAMLQLSQAFSSGVLRGQEFNSVNEAGPRIMKALADGMGVPIGALREMANAGKITTEVMANALPRALEELKKEAVAVQTISGAFQVLKNNVMEFVGASAQSNGAVSVLTRGIGLLADNLSLLAGAVLTVAAVKLATWLTGITTGLMASVAANRAAAAAALLTAQANATATASAVALTAARVAELRAAVIAAEGNVALAITTNGLVPAQARAIAAEAAHVASLAALTTAQRAASLTATVAGSALTFLGGPVGAVIAALGLAATAWTVWGNSAEDANKLAAESTASSTGEILFNLEKQNEKLRDRISLLKAGSAEAAKEGGEPAAKMAEILKRMEEVRKNGSNPLSNADMVQLITLQGMYDRINNSLLESKDLQKQISDIGKQTKAAEWAEKYASKAEKLAAELKKAKDELGAFFTPQLEARIRDKFKEKEIKEKITDYQKLTREIAKLTAEEQKRIALGRELTDGEKRQIDLMAGLASGALKMTEKEIPLAKALLATFDAQQKVRIESEKLKKVREELTQIVTKAEIANAEHISRLKLENSLVGKSVLQQQLLRDEYESNLTLKRQIKEIDDKTNGMTDPAAVAKLKAESEARIQAIKDEARARINARYLDEVAMTVKAHKNPDLIAVSGATQIQAEAALRLAAAEAEHTQAIQKIADYDAIFAREKAQREFDRDMRLEDIRNANEKANIAADIQDAEIERLKTIREYQDGQISGRTNDSAEDEIKAQQLISAGFVERVAFLEEVKKKNDDLHNSISANLLNELTIEQVRNEVSIEGIEKYKAAVQKLSDKQQEIAAFAKDEDAAKRLGIAYQLKLQEEHLHYLATRSAFEIEGIGTGKERIAIESEIVRLNKELAGLDVGAAAKAKLAADAEKTKLESARILAETAQKTLWSNMITTMESDFHNGMLRLLEQGKTTWSAMIKGFANSFKVGVVDYMYKQLAKPIVFKFIASMAGLAGANGMALAANTAADAVSPGMSTTSWLSIGKSLWDGMSSGFTSFGTGITSTLDSIGGNLLFSNNQLLSKAGEMLLNNSTGIGTASGYLGAAAAGVTIGTFIAGDKTLLGLNGMTSSSIGAALGAFFGGPIGAFFGGIAGGALNALFGMGPKQYEQSTVRGGFSGAGFEGGINTHWTQKGGLFRSNKDGDEPTALTDPAQQMLNGMVGKAGVSFARLITLSGDAARSVDGWNFAIDRALVTEEDITKLFGDMADSMGAFVIPELEKFRAKGENLADTAVRMGDEYIITDSIFKMLGFTTAETGIASLGMRDSLIQLMGGIQATSATMDSYYKNFYTADEQQANSLRQVNDAFELLGVTVPVTRAEFRALAETLVTDTTPAGQALFASFMKLNPAFAAVTQSTEDLAAAAVDAANQLAAATLTVMNSISSALDRLRGTNSASIFQAQLAQDTAMVALTAAAPWIESMDQLQTITMEDAGNYSLANKQLIAGALGAAASLKELQDKIRSDSIASAQKSVADAFSRVQKAVQAERDLITAAYQSSLDKVNKSVTTVNASIDKLKSLSGALKQSVASILPPTRAQAQAQIMAALAIARAGGGLPSAESLSGALQSISEPSERLFSTFAEWQTDQKITANNIAALAGMSDEQITVQDKQLGVLEATRQVLEGTQAETMKRLDGILTRGQLQIDQMNGIDTSIISVADAVNIMSDALNNYLRVKNNEPGFIGNESAGTGTGPGGTYSFEDQYRDRYGAGATASAGKGISGGVTGGAHNSTAFNQAWSALNNVPWRSKDNQDALEQYLRLITANKPTQYHIPPGFAMGTDYVPQDMTARIHEGEAIIPKAYNRSNATTNTELVTIVRELIETVKAGDIAIAKNTGESAKYAKRWDGNGILVRAETTNPLPVRQTA